jgi:hypothetical protein
MTMVVAGTAGRSAERSSERRDGDNKQPAPYTAA